MLCDFFRNNNFEVHYACIRGGEGPLHKKLKSLNVITHFFTPLSSLSKVGLLGRVKIILKYIVFIRKISPELIYPFTEPINILTNALKPILGVKKIVYSMRSGYIIQNPVNRLSKLAKLWGPIYVSNSKHGAKLQADFLQVPLGKFTIIPNAIQNSKSEKNQTNWRKKLGLNQDAFVYLMVANFYEEKNHALLIKAWPKVLNHFPNSKLVLVGSPGPFDKHYFKIKALAFDLKLHESVIFLNEVEMVLSLMLEADCGIHLSYSEGCPNVVLEFLMSNNVFIGSNIPAITEILDEDYPLLVENNDEDKLAEKMIEVQSNSTSFEKHRKKNFQYVSQHYSVEAFEKKYETVFKKQGVLSN